MADSSNTTSMPEILTSRVSACAFRIVIVVHNRDDFEEAIETLIAKLDEIDPDPDLQDDNTAEPWLGAAEIHDSNNGWSGALPYDLELDNCDDEPSLGSTNVELPAPLYRLGGGHGHCLFPMHQEPGPLLHSSCPGFNQTTWAKGVRDDREDEHDGREQCCEDEGAQCDDEGALDDLPADDGFPGPIFGEGVVIDNVTPKRNYSQVPVRQLDEVRHG